MSPLERRYRRLLRAYPKQYRTERADEMVGTLLETAAPAQRWPSARETAALICGGIRARYARNDDLPVLANLRLAAMLACATLLAFELGILSEQLLWPFNRSSGATYEWITYAGMLVATMLICFVRRELAVLALLAVLTAGYFLGVHPPLAAAVVLVLAVLTALRTERPPRAWLLWSCLPVAYFLIVLLPLSSAVPDPGPRIVLIFVLLALFVLGPLVWAITDARPLFALAMLMTYVALVRLAEGEVSPGMLDYIWVAGILVAALPLVVRIVRHRRRATV